MKLHEYQSKLLLKNVGLPVPAGIMAENAEDAFMAAKEIEKQTGLKSWAVKAQIHAGGRGKGGGIKIASGLEDVRKFASEMIGMNLVTPQTGKEGKKVRKVLVEQSIYYPGDNLPKEYYISILLNRTDVCYTIVYSTEGGMDIEAVAENSPHLIFRENIDPKCGLMPFQTRKIAFNLKIPAEALKETLTFINSLYKACIQYDATLIEINPMVVASDNKIFAADAKMIIDDNSLYRHPDLKCMRDISEEDPFEVEAGEYNLNFIKLDGNVGCMVNGAGLAMATMDIIQQSGGKPANFLDVGGGANAKTVEAGFRIILKDAKVKAILINIFGGIVRCDRVAQGVVDAYRSIGEIPVPVIVRLQGTNAIDAKQLIDHSGLKVFSATELDDAAKLVKEVVEKDTR